MKKLLSLFRSKVNKKYADMKEKREKKAIIAYSHVSYRFTKPFYPSGLRH